MLSLRQPLTQATAYSPASWTPAPLLAQEHRHPPQHSRGSPIAFRAHSQELRAARLMLQQVTERQRLRQPPASHRWQGGAGRGHEGGCLVGGGGRGTGELGDQRRHAARQNLQAGPVRVQAVLQECLRACRAQRPGQTAAPQRSGSQARRAQVMLSNKWRERTPKQAPRQAPQEPILAHHCCEAVQNYL
jgi:hypothetical protein